MALSESCATVLLRKIVTVAGSKEGLGPFVFPYVRLGTPTPICFPWQDIEAEERIFLGRTATEYRITNLTRYAIRFPSNLAKKIEAERARTIPAIGLSLPEYTQRRIL